MVSLLQTQTEQNIYVTHGRCGVLQPTLLLHVTNKSEKQVSYSACLSAHVSDHGLTAAVKDRAPRGSCKAPDAQKRATRSAQRQATPQKRSMHWRASAATQNAETHTCSARVHTHRSHKRRTSQRLNAAAICCTCSHVSVSIFEVLTHNSTAPGVDISTHKLTLLLLVHCAPLPHVAQTAVGPAVAAGPQLT